MLAAHETVCTQMSARPASSFKAIPSNSNVLLKLPAITSYSGSQVGTVSGVGNFPFLRTGTSGKISKLSALTGSAIIRGANITSVSSMVGNVILRGGQTGSVDGLTGNLIIVGGDFPTKITKMAGQVAVKTADGKHEARAYKIN